MPVEHIHPSALPILAEAFSLLPVCVGVADRKGNFLTLVGGLAGLMGKRHSLRDPARAARWRVYDETGVALDPKDWPSQRALRGETVMSGARATYKDESGQERHFRIGAAPIELPDSGPGYVFLLQDVRDEQSAIDRMQGQIERHLSGVVSDTIRRYRSQPLAADMPAGASPESESEALAPATALTNREQGVLRLLALGHSRKEIAARLGIAVKTADFYQAAGMRKAGLRNRTDVVQYAIASGWMQPEPVRTAARMRRA